MPETKSAQIMSIAGRTLRSGALALAAAALCATTAAAAPKEDIVLKFHVYASSLKVATLQFEIGLEQKRYSLRSTMKTKGLLNFVASRNFSATAEGRVGRNSAVPVTFQMITNSRKHGERVQSVSWSGNRTPQLKRSWQLSDFKLQSLSATVAPNQPDPLSALLSASLRPTKSLCKDKFRITDGKTIYDLVYSYVGPDSFGPDDYGVYRGEAHKCQITYIPVAGLSQKKLNKFAQKPNKGRETFTVWMAPVRATNLDRLVYVPVGGAATLDGRQMYAYLIFSIMSGKPLNELSSVALKK